MANPFNLIGGRNARSGDVPVWNAQINQWQPQALAIRSQTKPGTPSDGMLWTYDATALGDGLATDWLFRWNASRNVWVYEGGDPVYHYASANFNLTLNNTWQEISGVAGMRITVPFSGTYKVTTSALIKCTTAGNVQSYLSANLNSVGGSPAVIGAVLHPILGDITVHTDLPVTAAAGDYFNLAGFTNGVGAGGTNAVEYFNRFIQMVPYQLS